MQTAELTKGIRRVLSSLEINTIWLSSYFPSNSIRQLALRCWGAKIGKGVALHRGLQVRCARRLIIGDDCYLAEDVVLDARGGLEVGDSVSINTGVQIWTAQHDWKSPDFAYTSDAVRIGHHCWISARTIIIPGKSVGNGSVVAAGSVVVRDIPEWTLAGGNPAKVLADRPKVDEYVLNASRSKLLWW